MVEESRIRIMFLIPALGAGGAERQMAELALHLDPRRFELHLVEFYESRHQEGAFWKALESSPSITIHSLHKRPGLLGYATAVPRFLALLLRIRPALLYGFLAGTYLGLLARLTGAKVVWGIRRTSADPSKMDPLSRRLVPVTLWCSGLAHLVIFNSEAGRANHVAMGLRARRLAVIPNGFDVEAYAPDAASGRARRSRWGIPPEGALVGLVGRLVPVKDHPTFLRAAALVAAQLPDVHFVCVGGGSAGGYAASLKAMAVELGLGDRVHWPGVCEEMPAAYNALDLLVLASTDEGCPNAIGEAMACGVPCVTTDAGDAARLVGDTGIVTAVGDHRALAQGILRMLGESTGDRARRAQAARQRIAEAFSTATLMRATEHAFLELLEAPPPREG